MDSAVFQDSQQYCGHALIDLPALATQSCIVTYLVDQSTHVHAAVPLCHGGQGLTPLSDDAGEVVAPNIMWLWGATCAYGCQQHPLTLSATHWLTPGKEAVSQELMGSVTLTLVSVTSPSLLILNGQVTFTPASAHMEAGCSKC